jgi:uncharacterized cupin superfamily protein
MWNRSRPHDRRERLFGGSGAVLVWSLCDAPRPPFGAILACELEGGGSVGAHVQQELAEVVIVIEGEGVARVGGGSPTVMRPGVVVELPLGQTLALENASREAPLRYLIVKAK